MTRAQFARAVRADEKWVENAARQLGRQLAYTPAEARRMGLVRVLARDFGIPLVRADALAETALRHSPETRALALVEATDGSAVLVLDLARYHSTFGVALSTALHHASPRQRGRPRTTPRARRRDPVAVAASHGVDLTLLRESLRHTPAERLASLDENAAFAAALRRVVPRVDEDARRAG